jgi:hypothetical protein
MFVVLDIPNLASWIPTGTFALCFFFLLVRHFQIHAHSKTSLPQNKGSLGWARFIALAGAYLNPAFRLSRLPHLQLREGELMPPVHAFLFKRWLVALSCIQSLNPEPSGSLPAPRSRLQAT